MATCISEYGGASTSEVTSYRHELGGETMPEGDTLVVAIYKSSVNATVTDIDDEPNGGSNTWAKIGEWGRVEMWWAKMVVPTTHVTVTVSVACGIAVSFMQWRALDTLDISHGATGTGTIADSGETDTNPAAGAIGTGFAASTNTLTAVWFASGWSPRGSTRHYGVTNSLTSAFKYTTSSPERLTCDMVDSCDWIAAVATFTVVESGTVTGAAALAAAATVAVSAIVYSSVAVDGAATVAVSTQVARLATVAIAGAAATSATTDVSPKTASVEIACAAAVSSLGRLTANGVLTLICAASLSTTAGASTLTSVAMHAYSSVAVTPLLGFVAAMYPFGEKISSRGTSYPPNVVLSWLTSRSAVESWRFDRLDRAGSMLADISDKVIACSINHDATRAVMRDVAATFTGTPPLDFDADMMRVYYRIKAPDGGWIDFALGTFIFSTPTKTITPMFTNREVSGSDVSVLKIEASFTDTYTLAAGTDVLQAVRDLLADMPFPAVIVGGPILSTAPQTYEPGRPILEAINAMLASVGYEPLSVDGMGVPGARPLQDYTAMQPRYIFDTTDAATTVVVDDITEAPDRSGAYNEFVVIVSPSGLPSFTATYINDSPDSPVSTVNWHRRTKTIEDSSIVDSPTALLRAKSEAQASARVYTKVQISTMPWALSETRDVYGLLWDTDDEGRVSYNYVEEAWSHECATGGVSAHTLTRIVPA